MRDERVISNALSSHTIIKSKDNNEDHGCVSSVLKVYIFTASRTPVKNHF